ncbi:MAG: hypothetical protein WA393_02485 [Nitrososphaeraceae archaeon]
MNKYDKNLSRFEVGNEKVKGFETSQKYNTGITKNRIFYMKWGITLDRKTLFRNKKPIPIQPTSSSMMHNL